MQICLKGEVPEETLQDSLLGVKKTQHVGRCFPSFKSTQRWLQLWPKGARLHLELTAKFGGGIHNCKL